MNLLGLGSPFGLSQAFIGNISARLQYGSLRESKRTGTGPLACLLDLFGVDFLSVPAVIGVARDMALSVPDKSDASQIILHEKRLGP